MYIGLSSFRLNKTLYINKMPKICKKILREVRRCFNLLLIFQENLIVGGEIKKCVGVFPAINCETEGAKRLKIFLLETDKECSRNKVLGSLMT